CLPVRSETAPRACSPGVFDALWRRPIQLAQARPLPSLSVEIFRRQPALESGLALGPFGVEHRVIGGVAGPAFDDHMLAQDALEHEAVPQRRSPRRRVERVALPLISPVAKRLERVAAKQILHLGSERRALQGRRIEYIADLDDAHGGTDFHQRRDADSITGSIDDRVGIGIVELHAAGEPFRERREIREWAVGHIGPDLVVAFDGVPQRLVVMLSQPFYPAIAALERYWPGALCGRCIDCQSDWLLGDGMWLGRACHRFFISSRKKVLSSALAMLPARLSNLPFVAMSRAARMIAVQATRASVPPRLMRRTPSPARSFTVRSVALDMRKFTGFGATAFTTAAICSRVLMPGA